MKRESDPMYWVVAGELAGRAGPHNVPWDLWTLAARNVLAVVSLDGPVADDFAAVGVRHLPAYMPMVALHAADRDEFVASLDPILAFVADCRRLGSAVLVHCFHGNDRTGAVLACGLVAHYGMSPGDAVAAVRRANPMAMSVPGYEAVVRHFARRRATAPLPDPETPTPAEPI